MECRKCSSKIRKKNKHFISNLKTKIDNLEDPGELYIGLIFNICLTNIDKRDIRDDVKHSIVMLNKDYSNKSDNFDYGKKKYSGRLLNAYNQYTELSADTKLKFYCKKIIYYDIKRIESNDSDKITKKLLKKGVKSFEPTEFLNLFIVDFDDSLLGYSSFAWEDKEIELPGSIINKSTFGIDPENKTFNLNKTMTHELGHLLGLLHNFQETDNSSDAIINYSVEENREKYIGDCVIDTPPQGDMTTGDPTEKPRNWPRVKCSDQKKMYFNMFMNFMDYSDDCCTFMFTKDQGLKMRIMMTIFRKNIVEKQEEYKGDYNSYFA